jgi:magnesium-transporting ATPase (P-type)
MAQRHGVADTLYGLTEAEVAERRRLGRTNRYVMPVSRTIGEIVRANVLTRFNLLVGSLVAVILIVGPLQDAVFGLVMVINSAIGIVQEWRAKRLLDRLALVSAPRVTVIRDGTDHDILPGDVVIDDLMRVGRGDQLVVDAEVVRSAGLEMDESLITGESEPCAKTEGEVCFSGAAVAAGSGVVRATRVGEQSFAARLSLEARKFGLVASELRAGTDRILRWIGWALLPTAVVLVWSQIRAAGSGAEAARGAVSGTVGMVPQGLVLLISLALAVGVARLARMKVLIQDLGALEGLARVDVLCFDKTGTLTSGRMRLLDVMPVEGAGEEASSALGALVHADPDPNATCRVIAEALPPDPDWMAAGFVPFRSDRRWSAADFGDRGIWLLGAPDALAPHDDRVSALVEAHVTAGHRVLLLARRAAGVEPFGSRQDPLVVPAAVVALGDEIRSDAAATVAYFAEQGVALKVISGDHAATVAAIAGAAGIHGAVLTGADLPHDGRSLAGTVERTTVFGRIGPQEKQSMIQALRANGHVVAMVGDGVNDVLALKAADVGIAIGSGSAAARAVAPLVLVDGRFSRMPNVVAEGRRVIGNIERVAEMYLTKTVYAFMLAWAVGVAGWVFPLLPRHYTVIGALTIGIPSFWLALEPSRARAETGFVGRVLRFGIPVGTVTAVAGFVAFWVARAERVGVAESQSVTTLTLVLTGLAVLVLVARPLTPVRKLIATTMGLASVLVFTLPGLRDFYALGLPRPAVVLAAVGIVALTGAVMYGALRASGWWHEFPAALRELGGLARGPDVG